jgi:hypothetical protein
MTYTKITPQQVGTSHTCSLSGKQLAMWAGRKVNLSTLERKVNEGTTLVSLILAVKNPHRREILRREANNANGVGVRNRGQVGQQQPPQTSTTGRTQAKVDGTKALAKVAAEAAVAAYPEHPRLAAKRAYGLVMGGMGIAEAVEATGPVVEHFHKTGEVLPLTRQTLNA